MSKKLKLRTDAHGSEEYLRVLAFIMEQPDGEFLSYKQVAAQTEVPMTRSGKDMLRRATLRCRREYSVIVGEGYKLAEAQDTRGILGHRLRKVDSTMRRAERSQKILQARFFGQLDQQEQTSILYLGSIFGAIRQHVEAGKKSFGRQHQISGTPPVVDVPMLNYPI